MHFTQFIVFIVMYARNGTWLIEMIFFLFYSILHKLG